MKGSWAESDLSPNSSIIEDPDDGVNSWGDVLLKITVKPRNPKKVEEAPNNVTNSTNGEGSESSEMGNSTNSGAGLNSTINSTMS